LGLADIDATDVIPGFATRYPVRQPNEDNARLTLAQKTLARISNKRLCMIWNIAFFSIAAKLFFAPQQAPVQI
jgi:hypothetical protein